MVSTSICSIGVVHVKEYIVIDTKKIRALLVGAFGFLVFKNWNINYSPVINTISAAIFGVLPIHAS